MPTLADFAIVTSRSHIASFQTCPRKGWWEWLAPNSAGTLGWERRRLALPLATGIYWHRGGEHLYRNGIGSAEAAAKFASDSYRKDVSERGLDVEVDADVQFVIDEQAAWLEASILGYARIRYPQVLDEAETVDVEREELVDLGSGVGFQARTDVLERRRADARLFVRNFKTVNSPDQRWQDSWETDLQLVTEVFAVEARTGEQVAGVIIEGIIKGPRVGTDERLVEIRKEGVKPSRYIQRSRLLYGYKVDADPPFQEALFDWESTTKKGWHKFAIRDDYDLRQRAGDLSNTAYWVGWLPEEVVASQFVPLPPILRNKQAIEDAQAQVVAETLRTKDSGDYCNAAWGDEPEVKRRLNERFPQHTHSCRWPSKCPMYDACWSGGVREALLKLDGSGIYVPRVSHHPTNGGSE